jgi:hypothetical protein
VCRCVCVCVGACGVCVCVRAWMVCVNEGEGARSVVCRIVSCVCVRTLSVQRCLAGLVLCDLVHRVLSALGRCAERLPGLRDVDHPATGCFVCVAVQPMG